MKRVIGCLAFVVLLSPGGVAPAAGQTDSPLSLYYTVTDLGDGTYQYDFTLLLDNHTGDWVPQQGWGWLVFGDAPYQASALADFQMAPDEFPVGPWTSIGLSSGYHNGPTFESVSSLWVPANIGDRLSWSGTSASFLDQGQLQFSTLNTRNGATAADFETAVLTAP
jgi:hypothetical protein